MLDSKLLFQTEITTINVFKNYYHRYHYHMPSLLLICLKLKKKIMKEINFNFSGESKSEVDNEKLVISDPVFLTVFAFCVHFVFAKYARSHLLHKSSIFSYPFECLGQSNTVLYFHTYQEKISFMMAVFSSFLLHWLSYSEIWKCEKLKHLLVQQQKNSHLISGS